MDIIGELQFLWLTIIGLPAQVWIQALYLFILVGLLKAVHVVRLDGVAAATNGFFAIVAGGGFAALTDLNAALQVSATAVLAAVYYGIWKYTFADYVNGLLEKFGPWLRNKLPWLK